MQISKIGTKLSELSGVRKIMNDIIKTLSSKKEGEHIINMSAGNPLVLPELLKMWKKHSKELINSSEYGEIIGRYGATKGYDKFLNTITKYIKQEFNHDINPQENILITGGTQSLYFMAINTYGGEMEDGTFKKIFLPQNPDYTGYQGMAMTNGIFIYNEPKFIKTGPHSFKYKIDFNNLPDKKEIGAILLSRPCNPTGNIILDSEVKKLYEYINNTDIPLFLDSAYGTPIPNLAFKEMKTIFHKNMVYGLSLSKAGLPGERIGIAVGDSKFLKPLESFQSNSCISSSKFGQALGARAIESGGLKEISKNIINSFYKNKFETFNKNIKKNMPDSIPYYIHETEGSMFAFMWFEDLPISDNELYEKLKKEKVLFTPANSFFLGNSKHSKECLRISITVNDIDIENSIKILAKVITSVYRNK